MHRRSLLTAAAAAVTTAAARAQAPSETPATSIPSDFTRLIPYAPIGLSLPNGYQRGKIPVLFVHGLWMAPWSWSTMIDALRADPEIDQTFQLWTYGYSTGDPLLYSAQRLRSDISDARALATVDPTDPAISRAVIVGHSLGGLISWLQITDSGQSLWRVVSSHPIEQLVADEEDLELIRRSFFFQADPRIARAVFIASPHRGSPVDSGSLHRLGKGLIRRPDALNAAHRRVSRKNPGDFFSDFFRKGLPTSLDDIAWESPLLRASHELRPRPQTRLHSIIATLSGKAAVGETDGLVPYESAHIDGVESEAVIRTGHFCQGDPRVIAEVRRILLEHARNA